MDAITLIILGGLAIAAIIAVLVTLHRSWGDFPGRAGMPPSISAATPGISARPPAPFQSEEDDEEADEEMMAEENEEWSEQPRAADAPIGLMLIDHPLMRRAAEESLARGGNAAKYIIRDGDLLYFSFDMIKDPAQRQAAYDLMRRFQAGEQIDMLAMLKTMGQVFKT